jgi:citrate lyase subunit beta/citryl-CoA lyase
MVVRPVELRRSWLFVGGADREVLLQAADCGADVAMQELEDFTAPERRPEARSMIAEVMQAWRQAGLVAGVRINRLDSDDGPLDLAAAMAAAPDLISLPMVHDAGEIVALDREIARLERAHGLRAGTTEIMPCVETAHGLRLTFDICHASPRVTAATVAAEDLGTDLGVERTRGGAEMRHARERFLVDCVAAGTAPIDMPYTWTDGAGLEADILTARAMGFKAKAAVSNVHAEAINRLMTPSAGEAAHARRVVDAFEAARARGEGRVEVDGSLIEVPIFRTAKRICQRAAAFAGIEEER